MGNLNNFPEDVETHESWLAYNDIDEDTYIHMIQEPLNAQKFSWNESLLNIEWMHIWKYY